MALTPQQISAVTNTLSPARMGTYLNAPGFGSAATPLTIYVTLEKTCCALHFHPAMLAVHPYDCASLLKLPPLATVFRGALCLERFGFGGLFFDLERLRNCHPQRDLARLGTQVWH